MTSIWTYNNKLKVVCGQCSHVNPENYFFYNHLTLCSNCYFGPRQIVDLITYSYGQCLIINRERKIACRLRHHNIHSVGLLAVLEIIRMFGPNCTIRTTNKYIVSSFRNMIPQWLKTNWVNLNGRPVKNHTIFKEIIGMGYGLLTFQIFESNEYEKRFLNGVQGGSLDSKYKDWQLYAIVSNIKSGNNEDDVYNEYNGIAEGDKEKEYDEVDDEA